MDFIIEVEGFNPVSEWYKVEAVDEESASEKAKELFHEQYPRALENFTEIEELTELKTEGEGCVE